MNVRPAAERSEGTALGQGRTPAEPTSSREGLFWRESEVTNFGDCWWELGSLYSGGLGATSPQRPLCGRNSRTPQAEPSPTGEEQPRRAGEGGQRRSQGRTRSPHRRASGGAKGKGTSGDRREGPRARGAGGPRRGSPTPKARAGRGARGGGRVAPRGGDPPHPRPSPHQRRAQTRRP